MRISFKLKGDFTKTNSYLTKLKKAIVMKKISRYGEKGVEALKSATPVDTGETAQLWRYEIETTETGYAIVFHNDNVVKGWYNVALMLDVGHGTGSGGWVEGRNYIEPALRPVFDKMAKDAWLEVTSL